MSEKKSESEKAEKSAAPKAYKALCLLGLGPGRRYEVGAKVPAGKLSEDETKSLLAAKAITPLE